MEEAKIADREARDFASLEDGDLDDVDDDISLFFFLWNFDFLMLAVVLVRFLSSCVVRGFG